MRKKEKDTKRSPSSKAMLLSSSSPFSVQEAYKTLRANVTFSLPGTGCKCIGITSANRGEGKSTVAVNLTISLAQLNKKVVLIDCDLRLPTVISKLNINAKEGLSNYLSGQIEEVPVVRIKNLGVDIIPSGTIPPDATTLINSNEMLKLVELLKETYDYIVFDFPPINVVSDAVLLSGMIDGYLLVIRHELSEYQSVNEMLRQLKFSEAKIIGCVYNGKAEERKYYKKKRYGKYGRYGRYGDYYYKDYYKKSSQ